MICMRCCLLFAVIFTLQASKAVAKKATSKGLGSLLPAAAHLDQLA